jgi:hypothetical protein
VEGFGLKTEAVGKHLTVSVFYIEPANLLPRLKFIVMRV